MTTQANPATGEILEASDQERSDAQLLEEWASIETMRRALQERKLDIEKEIVARLGERGARAIDSDLVDVTLSKGTDVNRLLLDPILKLEGIPKDKLGEAYQPWRMIEAPPSWNLTKLKALVKYNGQVKTIIENATYETAPQLSMKPKARKLEKTYARMEMTITDASVPIELEAKKEGGL